MATDHRERLARIRRFDQLVAYLRDELGWPIDSDDFEELTFEYTPEELGIDAKNAAKIQEIKRLRPLSSGQPWGIFFVKFEPKRLPVVALRRILGQVALKKRASANKSERQAWAADDLLFVSNYGEGEERQISFAHFSRAQDDQNLPALKVLGWDNRDTALHLDAVARELTAHLAWPDDDHDAKAWRTCWRAAFTLRHREVVTTSKALSIRLAELARNTRDRIKTALAIETDRGQLTKLMKAFQESLVHDLDADSFADMYAQTIAYGLLSARIADPQKKTTDDLAKHMRTNPFLRELMETFLKVGGRHGKAGGPGIDFDELGVSEVVELLDKANMEAVIRDFGDRNPQEDPVIHFYELFLKEYDAKKRMQRGVFYTPRPVVSYIVRSVDELLRTEFSLADGLADTTTWQEMAERFDDLEIPDGATSDQSFVQILDPATGTGTFLVEVIDLIYKTLVAKWKAQGHDEKKIDALWNEYIPKHLLTRLHGYELLMAPYAIAHLKIGLKLYETGYRFGGDERARVYLTNALEMAQDFAGRFEFAIPALAHEAQAVNEIKQRGMFTVVIGNPPYSHRANMLQPQQRAIVEPYKFIDGKRMKVRGALQLERNLNDDYVKFIRFAQTLADSVSRGVVGMITNNAYLENLTFPGMRNSLANSFNYIQIVDLHGSAKAGGATPVGEKDENVFDIQQGVAISLFAKTIANETTRSHVDLWGSRLHKTEILLDCPEGFKFRSFTPTPKFFLFNPEDDADHQEYMDWDPLDSIFRAFGTGIMTNRNGLTIAKTQAELAERLKFFVDPNVSDQVVSERLRTKSNALWDLKTARGKIAKMDVVKFFRPVDFRPFNTQTIFYHESAVDNMRRAVMNAACKDGNITLVSSRQQFKTGFHHAFVTRRMFDECLLSTASREKASGFSLLTADAPRTDLALDLTGINISEKYLASIWQGAGKAEAECKFCYIYSILYSDTYRKIYANQLKRGYPRVPQTRRKQLAMELSRLGQELTSLHLMESPKLDQATTDFIGDHAVEVGKVLWSKNTVWLDKAQTTGFKNVREEVWDFHIGGHQVCEKWLKDRKGHALSKDDIAHYKKIVVALSETIQLMHEIDEVIERHGGWPGAFATTDNASQLPRVAEPGHDYQS